MGKMPLYLKHVAFVGNFKGGSLPLKDIVYMAGGAPVDSIAHFTSYLVLGEGGESTAVFRKWMDNISRGFLIVLSPDDLCRIAVGLSPAPEPDRGTKEGVIVWTTDEADEHSKNLEITTWHYRRYKFATKYGVLQPDGSRARM